MPESASEFASQVDVFFFFKFNINYRPNYLNNLTINFSHVLSLIIWEN